MIVGDEIRRTVFRDTRTFYIDAGENMFSGQLVEFAKRFGGKKILDFGCATGNYCMALSHEGFEMTGVDVNREYVRIARTRGVDAHLVRGRTSFTDKSFDTVIAFEVLEHLPHPAKVIGEMKRLARRNVLFTVPHSGDIRALADHGLMFEHFADLDHKNFFTEESLYTLLAAHFRSVTVFKGDPIKPFVLFQGRLAQTVVKALTKSGMVRPRFFFRLYAIGEV